MVRNLATNERFITYVKTFMSVMYFIIYNEALPRVIPIVK